MARPRTATDGDLLLAAARTVQRIGPAHLTLADVAQEGGVAPATLVQRFGSKRGLLLALAKVAPAAVAEEMANLRAAHDSPLAALRAYAECMASIAPSPKELANHLAFLVMDLTDPEFHCLALEQARACQPELEGWIDAAVAAGELLPCDSGRLARLMQETLHGALVTWAIFREGTAPEWVRQEMDTLLAPYLAGKRRRAPRAKRSRKNHGSHR